MKERDKVLNVKIGAVGETGEYIHKATQKILLDKGYVWGNGSKDVQNYGAIPFYIKGKTLWQSSVDDAQTISAVDILSGKFDLDKWQISKNREKVCVYVDLSEMRGEANKVLNMALQSVWFASGYKWADGDKNTYKREMQYIFLYDEGIFFRDSLADYRRTCAYDSHCTLVELSLNDALNGEHKKYL